MSWALLPHPARRAATLEERALASAVYRCLEAMNQGLPAVSDDEGAYLVTARITKKAS